MPPAKCDVIQKEQLLPFAEKRACTGCRKIKSRCIIPPEAAICTRCSRLGLECTIPTHHRGVKQNDGSQPPPSSSHSATGGSSSSKSSSQHGMPESTRAPSPPADSPPGASTNPFSVQSLLDTTSAETTASKALLSSTVHSHLQQMPSVKVSGHSASRPLIESVIAAGLFDEAEVKELVDFYYEKLNPIIALLDTHIYTHKALKNNPDYRLLLAGICAVASKFIKPDRYIETLDFLKPALARIAADDVAPQLETIQTLSILAMWKHPKDGSSWRKVRYAVTQSFELGLHELFSPQKRSKHPPSRAFIQSQRTFLQLACFEDGYRDQRHLPPAIDPAILPDPREWIDSLGDMVQDIDVRLAASRENALIKRDLINALKASNAKSSNPSQPSRATCLRNARLIKMTITAETSAMQIWMNPPDSEINCQHSGRPCLLFHTTNTLFNYHRALYSIYSSPFLSGPSFSKDRQAAFQRCSELSVELFELFKGPYGQENYYRFVHDIVILNLAVAAVWICDNWRAMPNALAVQAAAAIRHAADATAPALDFHLEQGSYLARFLRFCCTKLPSTLSICESSPVGMEELTMSEDARWAMGFSAVMPGCFHGGSGRGAKRHQGNQSTAYHNGNGAPSGAAGISSTSGGPSMHHSGAPKRRRLESNGSHLAAAHQHQHSHPPPASDGTGGASASPYDSVDGHTPQHGHAFPAHHHRQQHHYSHHGNYQNGNDGFVHSPSGSFRAAGTPAGYQHQFPPGFNGQDTSSGPGSDSWSLFNDPAANGGGGWMNHGAAINFVSDSLNPPSYPTQWVADDDNSIITFLQNISSTAP